MYAKVIVLKGVGLIKYVYGTKSSNNIFDIM